MKNFREEILTTLKNHHYVPENIDFIKGTSVTDRCVYENADRFLRDANFEYDEQDGTVDIDPTLVIVMKDGSYFARSSQGNKEFFVYYTAPPKPTIEGVICLAPNLSVKRIAKIKECEDIIKKKQEEIDKLKSINYAFMSEI